MHHSLDIELTCQHILQQHKEGQVKKVKMALLTDNLAKKKRLIRFSIPFSILFYERKKYFQEVDFEVFHLRPPQGDLLATRELIRGHVDL